jgi:hypothetical protein
MGSEDDRHDREREIEKLEKQLKDYDTNGKQGTDI